MKVVSIALVGTLAAIPVVGQITSPDGVYKEMSVGTAQAILAIFAIIEFLVIVSMFRVWRKDIATDRTEAKEGSEALHKLIAGNSVALSTNALASDRMSVSVDGLERSVVGFSEAVKLNSEIVRNCNR